MLLRRAAAAAPAAARFGRAAARPPLPAARARAGHTSRAHWTPPPPPPAARVAPVARASSSSSRAGAPQFAVYKVLGDGSCMFRSLVRPRSVCMYAVACDGRVHGAERGGRSHNPATTRAHARRSRASSSRPGVRLWEHRGRARVRGGPIQLDPPASRSASHHPPIKFTGLPLPSHQVRPTLPPHLYGSSTPLPAQVLPPG
jgi:hypothetical protein